MVSKKKTLSARSNGMIKAPELTIKHPLLEAAVAPATADDDDLKNRQFYVAYSAAAKLFGDGKSLNTNLNISSKTGNTNNPALIVQYTNSWCPVLAHTPSIHLTFDGVTDDEIKKCELV